ncbi:MAG TPA: helix-turn-helix transcriptional regulator [Bacilli bacterium]|nr:helix-turn-helix transcriptional regulator [Bacilli bacterium]
MDKIKRLREARGITQKEMGSLLGIAKETYRNIENGLIRLKLDDYLEICTFLNVAPSYFLSEYDQKYAIAPKEQLNSLFALVDQLQTIKADIKILGFDQVKDNLLYMSDSVEDNE